MTSRRWAILIAVFFVGFLIPELYGYFSGTYTLSQSVWLWSDLLWPFGLVASFSVGLLFGHLFAPRKIFVRDTKTVSLVDAKFLKEREEDTRNQKRRAF